MPSIEISDKLINVVIMLPIFFVSLAVHEFAHAFMADKFGDNTPRSEGRLTLNPLHHLELWGSVLLPLFSMLSGYAFIGWAKPVSVSISNLSNPRTQFAKISIAGPLSNFLLALFVVLLANSFLPFFANNTTLHFYLEKISKLAIYLNVFLGFFNLLPIPPLDGFQIIDSLFPNPITAFLSRYAYAGILVLFLLISTPIWRVFVQFYMSIATVLFRLAGVA